MFLNVKVNIERWGGGGGGGGGKWVVSSFTFNIKH